MNVKCRYCGVLKEKKESYPDPIKKGFYYCDESHYTEHMQAIEDKKRKAEEKAEANRKKKFDPVYEELADIFGYRITNANLFKEIKLWRGVCNNEKILAYLQENKEYLKNKLARLDGSEGSRIMYISAILKNNLADYAATIRTEPEKIKVDCEIYEPVVNTRKRRRGLSALEDEVSGIGD